MRAGFLAQAMVVLGALSLAPPPRREIDRDEAQAVMDELLAAGISALGLVDAVGAEDFVRMGQAILAVHREDPGVTDVGQLLAVVRERSRAKMVATSEAALSSWDLTPPGAAEVDILRRYVERLELGTYEYPEPAKVAAEVVDIEVDRRDPTASRGRLVECSAGYHATFEPARGPSPKPLRARGWRWRR